MGCKEFKARRVTWKKGLKTLTDIKSRRSIKEIREIKIFIKTTCLCQNTEFNSRRIYTNKIFMGGDKKVRNKLGSSSSNQMRQYFSRIQSKINRKSLVINRLGGDKGDT